MKNAAALALLLAATFSGPALADAPPALALPAGPAPAVDGAAAGATWAQTPTVSLNYDYTYRRKSVESTVVHVTQDGSALYVAFIVTQRAAIIANQHTNGSSVLSDDYVGVYLYPQGVQGFSYAFFSNPIGTRYQTSSENSAYAPDWTAVAKATPDGYDVTMRIPLGIIRSGGSHSWRMQFVRFSQATNSLDTWTTSPTNSVSDPAFDGIVTGVGIAPAGIAGASSARNAPRVQLYGLGEATSAVNGGNTSRIGADLSIPVDPTASFVATLHPDYSNVESDQQTISPTAFARQYFEVRPFFTQLSSFFGEAMNCVNCPQTLYTPSIPTFSQGYGVEGAQGRTTFAAFDALGDGRTDQAQTLNYQYEDSNKTYTVNLQRVAVDAYGLNDDTESIDTGYLNQRSHLGVWSNNAYESGSLVSNASLAQYHDGGVMYVDPTTTVLAGPQRIGAQFDPLDGYVAQSDVLGYIAFLRHSFNFAPSFWLHDIQVSDFYGRYWNHFNQISQTDDSPQINFDLKDLLSIHVYASSSGVRTASNEFLPFNGNGVYLGYRVNTNTPTYVNYTGGPYYHGYLDAWTYLSTLPMTRRIHLTLETDEDKYDTTHAGEQSTTQWLERASFDWQPTKELQLDFGVRRIVGPNLPNSYQALTYANIYSPASPCNIAYGNPYIPGCYVNAGNISVAAHYLRGKNEFYIVYGNADNLATEPALFFKWIRYIGAQKGT